MPRLRTLIPLVLSAAPLITLGCGGENQEPTEKKPSTAVASTKEVVHGKGGNMPDSGDRSNQVTPVRSIDPRKAVEVVKGEVQGGEASHGPTPEGFLWLPSTESSIEDAPMEVKVPLGLNETIPTPAYNPITKAKFELGKQLYFEPRVSKDGTISCATCHNPAKGWTDQMANSIGIKGQRGGRSAPTVLNTAWGRTMFWDGRAPSLEGQAQGPIENKVEMGDQSYQEIIERLRTIPGYAGQFKKVFGTDVTLDGFAKAVATFERAAALSGNSAYDRYYTGNDNKALDDSQKRGMILFGLELNPGDEFKTDVVKKKANCTACHAGFNFTDEQFHNLGVGWDEKQAAFADFGRWVVTPIGSKNPADMGSFKTPTIREVVNTAPYMHDGSEKTLEDVVKYYNRGGNANPALDKDMKKLNLTDSEVADVVAFMKALTGEPRKIDLPKLPPGPDGKSPDPAAALEAPAPRTAMLDFHPSSSR